MKAVAHHLSTQNRPFQRFQNFLFLLLGRPMRERHLIHVSCQTDPRTHDDIRVRAAASQPFASLFQKSVDGHPTTSFFPPHHLFFTIAKQSVRFANKISGGVKRFAVSESKDSSNLKGGGGVTLSFPLIFFLKILSCRASRLPLQIPPFERPFEARAWRPPALHEASKTLFAP